MTTISIIIIAAAFLLAAVLNLTAKGRVRSRMLSMAWAIAIIFGLLLYGYGYIYVSGWTPDAILRTIVAVCRMVIGEHDFESVSDTPLYAYRLMTIAFWFAHLLTFYAVSATAIAAFGDKLMGRLRVALSWRKTLLVIYGVSEHTLEYARRQTEDQKRCVAFIGSCDASMESNVYEAGCVLAGGDQPDEAALKKLGIRPGKRHIEIAALHDYGAKNFAFARKMKDTLERIGILPDQTSLLMQDVDEDQAVSLSDLNGKYGYGSVMAFTGYELVARLMMQKMPPCDTVRFDENARAQNDFQVLMIGFGQMGRAALNALLMNGQFYASAFRADIFDPSAQKGALNDHEILKKYDIRFHESSGSSDEVYAFLKERKDAVRYIVLCTGSEKQNREIARDLRSWLSERGASPAIVQCTGRGLVFAGPDENESEHLSIYDSNVLNLEQIDKMAMVINHAYNSESGKSPLENWKKCDYFSRMSCRASADFYQAMVKAAGKTIQQVEDGSWPPEGDALVNLSITEHMRWCAFHHVMGFRTMSEAEFVQRVEWYQAEVKNKGSSSLRISKDMKNKKHACLIPWEELDRLAERESEITGKRMDYRKMDTNNVLILPEILAVLRNMPETRKK